MRAYRQSLTRAAGRGRAVLELAVRPHQGLERLYQSFGPVCSLGAGRARYVFLLGQEANRFVLANSELFRWREAFETLKVVDGETALIVSDGAEHQRRRRLVTPAFTRGQIGTYAETMRANADAMIDAWRTGQVIDLYRQLRRTIRRSTIQVLFGPRLAADEPELGDLLQHTLTVADRMPPWQQMQRLGFPSWRRALAARDMVARRVREEIAHRRSGADGAATDVLTLLLDSRDEDGSALTDVEITDQVISLIAAGYETTSAAMGWAAHALLADPGRWTSAAGSLDRPQGWRYLDGVVSETLRLYPPAVIVARKVVTGFDFAGNRVPAGSMLLCSPYLTHRLAEVWARPLTFDPARWDPDGPGYRRPAPHEFLPFGGPHRCLGAAFATTEMTVLLERLLSRTQLRLEPSDMAPVGLAAMRPRRGPFARVVSIG